MILQIKKNVIVVLFGFVFLVLLTLPESVMGDEKVAAKPPPEKPIYFSDYAKLSEKEEKKLINGTFEKIIRKLIQKGFNSRVQCIDSGFINSENPIGYYKLVGEMRSKAKLENETEEIQFKKPVTWYIASRILATCPSENISAQN